jgi:hypothetical protein
MSDTQPLAYLIISSEISLESYELSRLNRASNLRKEMLQMLDKWIDAETEARMARAILDWRRNEIADATCAPAEPTGAVGVCAGRIEDLTKANILSARERGQAVVAVPKALAGRIPKGTGAVNTPRVRRPRIVSNRRRAASMLRLLEQCPRSFAESAGGTD